MLDVLLPMRGGHRWLPAALSSLADQRDDFARVLIIDDGIDDPAQVESIASRALGDRFEVIANRGHGISSALNTGVMTSRARWIARMDADDVTLPGRFEKQLAWLECSPSDRVACGTQVHYIDSTGTQLGQSDYPLSDNAIRQQRLSRTCFAHPSLVIRRDVLLDVPYRPPLDGAEDVDLMLRLGERWCVGNLDEPLLDYRLHVGQVDADYRARQTALQELAFRLALQRERFGCDALDADPGLAEDFVDWRLGQSGYAASRQALTAARYAAAAVRGFSAGLLMHSSRQLLAARPWQTATRRWLTRVASGSRGSLLGDPLPANLATRLNDAPGGEQ